MIKQITAFFLIIPTLSFGACCLCAANYAELSTKASAYGAAIADLTAAEAKETQAVMQYKERQALNLANERRISETVARIKAVDSSGFAFTIARLKAEGAISDAERLEMMVDGYKQTGDEAVQILDEVSKK